MCYECSWYMLYKATARNADYTCMASVLDELRFVGGNG